MIKAIVFDIGGVVVPNLNFKIKKKIKDKNIFKKIFKYENDMDSGRITLNEIQKLFKNKIGNLNLNKIFIKTAEESKINNNIKKIILKLKKKYKLAYLSNTIKEHYIVRKKQHVYDLFHYGINSYKVKLRKPDPKIYKLLLKKIKVNPNESLFIDDKIKNINAAKRLGINVIKFNNTKQLIRDLRRFDIKI